MPLKEYFTQPRKNLVKRYFPLGVSLGLYTAVILSGISKANDNRKLSGTINEQRVMMAELEAQNNLCEPAATHDAADAGAPAESETVSDLRTKLIFADMKACSYFVDAVQLTTMRRNECKTRKTINMIVDVARDHCTKALGLVSSPEEKEMAEENLRKLDKLNEHPWITLGPCGKK